MIHFDKDFRQNQIKKLNETDTTYDICIVGGGITGAAIARDASLRGYKTLLVEKNDFASGTSSRSSKLVHGGVRYLEHLEFSLVFESTRERAKLWKNAPHLVKPIGFIFPAYKKSRQPLWKLNLGLWLYDILALFRTPTMHKKYNKKQTKKIEPSLNDKDLNGSIFYWDGITDDASLVLANLVEAHKNKATCLSRINFEKSKLNSNKPHEITLKDLITNETFNIKSKIIISATGPWTDEFLADQSIKYRKVMRPTRGSHIVVPNTKLPVNNAIVIFHPDDERVMFAIPWEESTIIGTTDIFTEQSPNDVVITSEEIKYLLKAANEYFPDTNITKKDVISTWSGLRPLVLEEGKSEAAISRDHFLKWVDPNICLMTGGKLTTHREMAEQCVDLVSKKIKEGSIQIENQITKCQTDKKPLPFVNNYDPKKSKIGTSNSTCLDDKDIESIIKNQMVLTIEDLLVRRTQIYYREPDNGLNFLQQKKTLIMSLLKISNTQWEEQLTTYKKFLQTNITSPIAGA